MKFSLTTKLALSYFILAIAFFFFTNMFAENYLRNKLTQDTIVRMKENGTELRSQLSMENLDSATSQRHIRQTIDAASSVSSYSISFFNFNGTVRYSACSTAADAGSSKTDDTFKETLKHSNLSTNTLDGFFKSEQILFITTVYQYQHPVGYLVLGTPVSQINEQISSLISIYNIFLIFFYVFLLLFFILLYFMHVYPIQRIIKAAKEYSKGHFDYRLTINSNDEYRILANTLSYMAEELKNLDDYQRTFIANVSHDFRSPLTSIKGYVDAFLDGTIPPERQEKYLNIILFETNRLSDLTKSLLTMNNFENGRNQMEITLFDINPFIRQIVDSFETISGKRNIRIICYFAEDRTYVKADAPKIQQVLHNLIDNAIKFSHHNSEIIVSTENSGEKTFIHVKDFGIGIPQDCIGKIWDRFYKTDLSRGKDKKGTGLGLSITKSIINAHKETIEVSSTKGAGTEFVFSLPRIRKVSV